MGLINGPITGLTGGDLCELLAFYENATDEKEAELQFAAAGPRAAVNAANVDKLDTNNKPRNASCVFTSNTR